MSKSGGIFFKLCDLLTISELEEPSSKATPLTPGNLVLFILINTYTICCGISVTREN